MSETHDFSDLVRAWRLAGGPDRRMADPGSTSGRRYLALSASFGVDLFRPPPHPPAPPSWLEPAVAQVRIPGRPWVTTTHSLALAAERLRQGIFNPFGGAETTPVREALRARYEEPIAAPLLGVRTACDGMVMELLTVLYPQAAGTVVPRD